VISGNVIELTHVTGLSAQDVLLRRQQYGRNVFQKGASRSFIQIVWDVVREPMFILLVIACSLYFILGEISEGIMMLVAMILVTVISLYQEVKSTQAVDALKQLTDPKVTVIRSGEETEIATEDLVPGDIILLAEGMNIPADATILQGNDLSVNESIITGESFPVEKHASEGYNKLYQGSHPQQR
jgi:Ca2+-transporting ATPase